MTIKYIIVNSAQITTDAYQRPLQSRVQRIADEWNEALANEPKLSFRDGKYFCFDGQHTIAARILRNGGKDVDIRCKVYSDMSYEDEAMLFAHQQDNSRKVGALDTVRALYEAKDPDVVNMFDMTNSLGIQMDFALYERDNKINCLDTALRLYKKHGSAKYMQIMMLIRDTWNGAYPCYNAAIVKGVAEFYTKYESKMNRSNFIKKLGSVHPVALMRDAKLRIGSKHKMLDEICEVYNKRLQNKLSAGVVTEFPKENAV